MLGTTAVAEEGDLGYVDEDNTSLTADQQSFRLMLDDTLENGEWSVHIRGMRRHLSGFSDAELGTSALFRYRELDGAWLDESGTSDSTYVGYELDRALYRHRFGDMTLSAGRQPIDWGSGRFWQPLNVFGAFSPTDLDTDFKPGIDAAMVEWYPSAFSSLSGAYAFAPEDDDTLENSGALYYRSQFGEMSELSLLAGSILGNRVVGAAVESAWEGMGWRIEGAEYRFDDSDETARFWIAGLDYQFDDGTLVIAEWYDNSHGAETEQALAATAVDPLVLSGLQQQLGRQVLGLGLERDLTPLLNGGYTLLASRLEDNEGDNSVSLLHQLNLRYSVSNESDLLFSLLAASGKGGDRLGNPRSEFGHLPLSLTLRLRFYF